MPILIPKCEKCNAEMILKEKGGEKFWGCANWKQCGGRTKPYAGVDNKPSLEAKNGRPDGFQVIGDTLFRIESKLDILLGDKLPKSEKVKNETPIVDENEISVSEIPF